MTAILPIVYLILGVILSHIMVGLGYSGRYRSHQAKVKRDLRFLIILTCVLIIAGYMLYQLCADLPADFTEAATVSALEAWVTEYGVVFAAVIAMAASYRRGYYMAAPGDSIILDDYSEDQLDEDASPTFYYYYGEDMCIMQQTLSAGIRAFFGARDLLMMDLASMVRTRSMSVSDGRRKVRVHVVPLIKHDIEYKVIGKCRIGHREIVDEKGNATMAYKHLFHFTIEEHHVKFADSVTSDPITFQQSVEVRNDAVAAVQAEKLKSIRLGVLLENSVYEEAGNMVSGFYDLKIDREAALAKVLDFLGEEEKKMSGQTPSEGGSEE
ncbi:MAG: hypothetical protein LBJ20_03740 [Candidatus Methanoplasma sp.]|nr:hypothetical protein [Candidatus Methanoplasma sp.]